MKKQDVKIGAKYVAKERAAPPLGGARVTERPDGDPPFFFRRVWSGGTDMDEVTVFKRQPDGTLAVMTGMPKADIPEGFRGAAETVPLVADGLVIYGRRVQPLSEDARVVRDWESRGLVWSECYSVECTEGEVGTHPLSAVTEITREEFEIARGRGWQ